MMHEDYQIIEVEQPEWDIIGQGLRAYNAQMAGEGKGQTLCFVLKAPDGETVGGVIGETHWDWLFVNLMWVRDDLRRKGYGGQLLQLAEEKARQRGANYAYLDTFSFQAPEFYRKQGYQIFGELLDFPFGHQRYFMRKKL
jgi:GNAT superfamily N-acetyltransferase